jgi:4'-phosphopantetheinyl transferase EntD
MKIQTHKFEHLEIQLINIKSDMRVVDLNDLQIWCTEDEFHQWLSIGSEKRRLEFAAVRYMLFVNDLKGMLYYEEEVPKLKNGVHISVSHSHDWVGLGFCASHRIGMDLELVQEKVARVYEKFIHEDERITFPKSDLCLITLLWSFKETIFKLMRHPGLLFSQDICVFRLENGIYKAEVSLEHGKFEVPLEHLFFDDYVLTFNSGDVQKQA